MKILFVTRKYPPSTGGMELFAHDLYSALAAKTDAKLVKWGGSNKALPLVIPYLFLRSLTLLRGVDVIHLQDGVLAPMGYVLSRISGKPYVVVIHGLDITYDTFLYKILVPWAVRKADKVFCISRAAAEAAKKRGVHPARIEIIHLAVNDTLYKASNRKALLEHLGLPQETKVLLTVGRLVRRKGVAWFVREVLPRLAGQYLSLVYAVVGEGEDRANIERAITESNMEEHVRLLGKADGELYEAAYNGADVFVMPNISVPGNMEGFGLVVLEATFCALPVVAADLEGIKDALVDGSNGVLVSSEDAEAFEREISKFLDDKAYAGKFGRAARNYSLAHYSWPEVADRSIECYSDLLFGPHNP